MKLHILTSGFTNPNGCAFLAPLIRFKRALLSRGVKFTIYSKLEDQIWDCDALIVENKYFGKRWGTECERVLEELSMFQEKIPKVFYFDITDSSGWDHARALPYVTAYLKNQLLLDKNLYLKPIYGNRIFSDYYHKIENVSDEYPETSVPVSDPQLLSKLGVGWNSGLANWSLRGPLRMALYRRFGWSKLLGTPRRWCSSSSKRANNISCRFGTNYSRMTVAWQRKKIASIMGHRLPTNKVSRAQYFAELEHSKVVVSPFGLGEITLKDFETFITGGLLFKPDMSHMETWPDIFQSGTTMLTHHWNLEGFQDQLDEVVNNYRNYLNIAQQGQDSYIKYMVSKEAKNIFCDHFINIIQKDWSQACSPNR